MIQNKNDGLFTELTYQSKGQYNQNWRVKKASVVGHNAEANERSIQY